MTPTPSRTEGLRHADSVVERAAFAPEWFCLNPEGSRCCRSARCTSATPIGSRGTAPVKATPRPTISTTTPARPTARPPALRAEAEQAEAQKRERRIVVNLNKLGAAATGVRRQFITTLLARLVDCTSWVSIDVGPAV